MTVTPPEPTTTNGPAVTTPTPTPGPDMASIAAREKSQGERAGRAATIEQLGVADVDEAKRLIDAARKAQQDQLSEQQKATQAAEQERAEAKREREAAAEEKLSARVERALFKAGVPAEVDGKENPNLLRIRRLLDIAPDADAETVKKAVDAVKADIPSLFTTPGPAPTGDPGVAPRKTNGGGEFGAAGRAMAEKWKTGQGLRG